MKTAKPTLWWRSLLEPPKEVPKPWVDTDVMPRPKTRMMKNTVMEVNIIWMRHHTGPLERR